MARGNFEDRVLEDAARDERLTDEQRIALGNYIHKGNSPYPRGDYQAAVSFIRDFLRSESWRQYLNT